MKSNIESFNNFYNKKLINIYGLSLMFFLIIFLFIFFLFLISLYNKKTVNVNEIIRQKDLEIEKLRKQLNDLNFKYNFKSTQNNEKMNDTINTLDKEYLYDKVHYSQHNMANQITLNKLGYESILYTHSLEKGMEMEQLEIRPFGLKKIEYIIELIRRESKFENYEKKFSFINMINTLRQYKTFYKKHGWDNKEEYMKVDNFLKNYTQVENQKAGIYILTKKELEKDYNIDYLKFIKSRHSTRNYRNESLKLEDVKTAVEMAKFSPSACNRQYIKLHFYPTGKMRDNVIQYAIGKGGFNLERVNTFIVTFDTNGLLGIGERNQGYFNAGLYSTNLVNAFHSLGIGTCFIQFCNSIKDENELKKKNEIPENERIAVILFAGYYDEKSIFTVSPRKNITELMIEHR